MPELVLRGRHNDHTVLAELLGAHGLPLREGRLLRRVVVDGPVAARQPAFARAASDSGTQLLIDPMTSLLADVQAADDSWAKLPYATHEAVPASTMQRPSWQKRLAEQVVEFQVDRGATAIIPPYIHLPAATGALADAQRGLWRATADVLAVAGSQYPVLPVLSVDRHPIAMNRTEWEAGLGRLLRAADDIATEPIGLALSGSSRPTSHSLFKSAEIWRRSIAITPTIAWQAGDMGSLAVALGASGYETGMCGAERCNAMSQMRNRRPTAGPSGPRWFGAYVDVLGNSITKSAVETMSRVRQLQGDLGCLDITCCPHGFASMLGTGRRQHAARRRLYDLAELAAITAPGWKLHHLQQRAEDGRSAAQRIRAYADRHGLAVGVYPAEYEAISRVLQGLRATARVAVA